MTNAERQKRYRASKTEDGPSVTVWERGGYKAEYIDGVFCVNGKPYRIGDILDLKNCGFIANLYRMKG